MKFIWRFIEALPNETSFKARNAADSADVDLFKLNSSDEFELLQNPLVPAPTVGGQVANKQYVDQKAADILAGANGIFYVGASGDDLTGAGTQLAPYATIQKALDEIALLPAGSYCVVLFPGTYTGADLNWPMNVSMVAEAPGTVRVEQKLVFTSLAGDFSIAINDISFSQTAELDFSASGAGSFIFSNCSVAVKRIDNGNNFYFVLANCGINGFELLGGATQIYDSIAQGPMSIAAPARLIAHSSIFANTFEVEGPATALFLNSTIVVPIQGINNGGAPTFALDAASLGLMAYAGGSLTGAYTLMRLDSAQNLGYAPGNPSDWAVQPDDVAEALDILADAVQNGGFGDIKSDGSVPFTGDQSMGGNKLTNASEVQAAILKVGASLMPISEGSGGGLDSFTKMLLPVDGSLADLTGLNTPVATQMGFDVLDKKFGSASLVKTNTNGYLSVPASPNFSMGAGDFTLDFWFKTPDVSGQKAFLAFSQDFASLGLLTWNGKMGYYASSDGATWNMLKADPFGPGTQNAEGTIPLQNNVWTHVAFVRSGNTFYGFIDGQLDIQVVAPGTLFDSSALDLWMGRWGNGGLYSDNGTKFDEIRVSKGVARWTAPFTPPAAPYGDNYFDFGAKNLSSSAAPQAASDLTNKQYVDAAAAAVQSEVDALEGVVTTLDGAVIKKNGSVAFTGNQSMGSNRLTSVADPVLAQDAATKNYADTTFIPLSQKGAANGVATLDGNGKLPSSQLTVDAFEYKGNWNALTNTPTLQAGVGNTGDIYRVSVAGVQDLGNGPETFDVGDRVCYNGATWDKWDTTDGVTSVNGQQGAVSLDSDDIPEGVTNLYFTDARAIAAAQASDLFIEKDGSVAFTGDQSMGSNKLTDVADPVAAQDAATKSYVDSLDGDNIKKDGSVAFTADQSLGGNKLTNVADPSANQDAATKAYVDAATAAVGVSFEGTRFVAKNGSDVTGDGSLRKPYLTVKAAMDSITDATNLKRYAIMVMPGRYTETGLVLKANVFVVGQQYFTTRIQNNTAIGLDASFTPAGDHRSGFVNINLASQVNADFAALSSNEGKIYFYGCQLAAGLVLSAFSNINQSFVENCDVFGGITQTGMTLVVRNTMVWSGNVTVNPRVGGQASLQVIAGSIAGNLALSGNNTDTILAKIQAAKVEGSVTADGSATTLQASADSLPATQSLLNGAVLVRLDLAQNVGFTPAVPGDWSVVPTQVKQALDTLAADLAGAGSGDIKSDGSVAFAADQSMGGNKLTNVADPVSAQDAATKAYVDGGDAATLASAESYADAVASRPQEQVVLTGGDIAAKQITLANTPLNASAVRLTVYGGPEQAFGIDFSVTGTTLTWNGLGLDGLLVAGDRLLIDYAY